MRSASLRDGFEERNVVHQVERLQRRVGAVLEDRALLAIGRIEIHHVGRRRGSLPVGVEAAAIEAFAFRLLVAFAAREFLPEARGLIRLHRGPADFLDQQSRNGERLIADRFRAEAQARAAREQPVIGVFRQQLRRDRGRLPVGRAHDDELLHAL